MVGLVIVSHSPKIAEGIRDLALQMTPAGIPLALVGGLSTGELGTNPEQVLEAINQVYSDDGVLILFDLGSAFMSAETAVEFLPEDKQERIYISGAALVEGAITAAVEISLGKPLEEINQSLESLNVGKIG